MVTRRRRGLPSGRWTWLRLSWRDLRDRAGAVVAIALVMAIGIGVFAGLGSTSTWRRLSNDESFAALRMHDLRATLAPGVVAREGTLLRAARGIDDGDAIAAASERLVVDSQVAATGDEGPVLVVARIVGMGTGARQAVDALWVERGAQPDPAAARPQAVLEAKFATDRGLPPAGSLLVAGGRRVDYTGVGMIPEDFYYEGPEGLIINAGELAPVYMPLAGAQRVTGRPGRVNDLVVRLAPGADGGRVATQLTAALAARGLAATVSPREDAFAVRTLYEDIGNDQRMWDALSALVLGAAAIAAFSLVSRVVEAQRREIGIGMALGVPRRRLAVRPMLVGAQVALLGTLAGLGVGLLVGEAMKGLLRDILPLPVQRAPFQLDAFGRAAALGIAIPLLASALPVWRALRVEPIEAIRTGHLAARRGRLGDWTRRLRLPGSSLVQMPVRNALRTPRRTLLTAVSVGAAITALVATLGMLDSFQRTIAQGDAELSRGAPGRVLVQLDGLHAAGSGVVASIAAAPAVGRVDAGLRLPVTALAGPGGEDLPLLLELVDTRRAAWTPTTGGAPLGDGVALARKAARDLGVGVGDLLVVRHPARRPDGTLGLVRAPVRVTAVHGNPLRGFAYMDLRAAARFGLAGVVNLVHAYPAPGATPAEVQRDVFALPGVASSQPVARVSGAFDDALDQFTGFLAITAAAVLALALLIALNASRITVEERRREHATMRAFGLPLRSVVGVVVAESLIVGAVATAIGIGAGRLVLGWMLRSLAGTSVPDVGVEATLAASTLGLAVAIGLAAVAAAPLLLVGRLRRMDIPSALRLVE
ncbi:ABC transporter permease [Miltoncostaea marina]|uniref:ABC transporter permease n=1 Tax=Miltoncostaea marina TaxID=2843215 RepID=UPI001C3CE94D|nr:ABC transporter permease [Miltoncostaea marina]